HQADADEPFGGGSDRLLETNNLLVEGFAVPSGFAPKNEEDRFAGAPRLGRRGRVVGIPAKSGGVELRRRGARGDDCERQDGEGAVHGSVLRRLMGASHFVLPDDFSSGFFSTSIFSTRGRSSKVHSSCTRLFSGTFLISATISLSGPPPWFGAPPRQC